MAFELVEGLKKRMLRAWRHIEKIKSFTRTRFCNRPASQVSNGHAAIDHVSIAGGKCRFVRCQKHHDGRNFVGLRQTPHGLARNEILAGLHRIGFGIDAVLQ
jgi:hypothetical protein